MQGKLHAPWSNTPPQDRHSAHQHHKGSEKACGFKRSAIPRFLLAFIYLSMRPWCLHVPSMALSTLQIFASLILLQTYKVITSIVIPVLQMMKLRQKVQ